MSFKINFTAVAYAAALSLSFLVVSPASAQYADSWVDIGKKGVGAGAKADGDFTYARTKSSSKNGVQLGHGLAVGAGPNGIAVSNSIGAGAGPLGVAHNVNLNIGKNGAHVSHGGVVSQGGNRRVTAGGSTGTQNGRVYGGSRARGYGNQTKAWSGSRTRNWVQPTYNQPSMNRSNAPRSQPTGRIVRGFRFR